MKLLVGDLHDRERGPRRLVLSVTVLRCAECTSHLQYLTTAHPPELHRSGPLPARPPLGQRPAGMHASSLDECAACRDLLVNPAMLASPAIDTPHMPLKPCMASAFLVGHSSPRAPLRKAGSRASASAHGPQNSLPSSSSGWGATCSTDSVHHRLITRRTARRDSMQLRAMMCMHETFTSDHREH